MREEVQVLIAACYYCCYFFTEVQTLSQIIPDKMDNTRVCLARNEGISCFPPTIRAPRSLHVLLAIDPLHFPYLALAKVCWNFYLIHCLGRFGFVRSLKALLTYFFPQAMSSFSTRLKTCVIGDVKSGT